MASSSSFIATTQPSSSIGRQPNASHQEIEYENNPSSPQISPKQTSFQQLLEPWFEITPTHHQDSSFSIQEFQPIPRSVIPSDSIRAAGFSLQSITNTTSGLFPAANLIPSFETYNLISSSYNSNGNQEIHELFATESSVYNPNANKTIDESHSHNSPVYNPNASAIYNGLFPHNSPVYNPNASVIHNGLFLRNSPVYNPTARGMYDGFCSNNSPVYNPNSSEIFYGSSSKNASHFQFDTKTFTSDHCSQSSLHSSQPTTIHQPFNQSNLNLNNQDDQPLSVGYTDWEIILPACDSIPLYILPLSEVPPSQGLKRSRSFDSYPSLCCVESSQPNDNFDLGSSPHPSKKLKNSN